MNERTQKILQILAVILIVLLDQVTKIWALNVLAVQGDITVIPGVFYLSFATNNGAAWSMLAGRRLLLVLISAAALVLISVILSRDWVDTKTGRWGMHLILGGAIGNLIDRALRTGGRVIDLFDFRLIHFPIFNVADIFICIGGALFTIFVLQTALRERRESRASRETPPVDEPDHTQEDTHED